MPKLDDLHEWMSFSDPDKDQTWIVDATFMMSNWTCIWGRGCKGVLDDDATALQHGCCSFGAHFIDKADLASVRASVRRLKPEHWAHHAKGARGQWLAKERDGSDKTRQLDGVCIFHNPAGFEGGAGCAFHVAALAARERPMDWKPDVCWQLPLRLDEHTEDDGHVVSFVREWKRRDWGEGGYDFHWWCTDHHSAFVGSRPVFLELKHELIELCGPTIYSRIVEAMKSRIGRTDVLPHPRARSRAR